MDFDQEHDNDSDISVQVIEQFGNQQNNNQARQYNPNQYQDLDSQSMISEEEPDMGYQPMNQQIFDMQMEQNQYEDDQLTQVSQSQDIHNQRDMEGLNRYWNAKMPDTRPIPANKDLQQNYSYQGAYVDQNGDVINPFMNEQPRLLQNQQRGPLKPFFSKQSKTCAVLNNRVFKQSLPHIQQGLQHKFNAHARPMQLNSIFLKSQNQKWRASKNYHIAVQSRTEEELEARQAQATYNLYDNQIRNAYEAYKIAKKNFSNSPVGSVTIVKSKFDALTIQELGMTSLRKWPMHSHAGINSPFYKDLILGQREALTDASVISENYIIVNPLALTTLQLTEKTTITHFQDGLPCLQNDVQILGALEQDVIFDQAIQLDEQSRVDFQVDQLVLFAIYIRDFLLSHLFKTMANPIVDFYANVEFILNIPNSEECCGQNIQYFLTELAEEFRKVKLYREDDENQTSHPLYKIQQFFNGLMEFRREAAREQMLNKIRFSCFQYCALACQSGQGKSYAGFNSIQDNKPVSFSTREAYQSKSSVINTKTSQTDAIPYFIFQCSTRKHTVMPAGIQYQWYKDFPFEFDAGYLIRHFESEHDMNDHCLRKQEIKKCHKAMIQAAQQAKAHLGNAGFNRLKNIIPGFDWNFMLGDKSN